MIRAGLVGYGLAGRVFHAPLLLAAGVEVRAIATSRRGEVGNDLPGTAVESDPFALLARPDIDLVVIATPNDTHHALGRAALEHGKHVVIDKPFTILSSEADDLVALAQRERRVLSAFHNRRWDSDFLTLRAVIESGELGEILLYQARYDRFRPVVPGRWRDRDGPGGGILYDLGSHLIDQVLVLFGPPDWVEADLSVQRQGAETVDAFRLTLGKGGARMELGVSMLAAEPGPKYVVHGREGSFIKSGADVQEEQLKAGMRPGMTGFGVEPDETWPTITTQKAEHIVRNRRGTLPGAYTSYYRGIVDAIRHGQAPPVRATEARAVVRVIELAMESHRLQRRVPLSIS